MGLTKRTLSAGDHMSSLSHPDFRSWVADVEKPLLWERMVFLRSACWLWGSEGCLGKGMGWFRSVCEMKQQFSGPHCGWPVPPLAGREQRGAGGSENVPPIYSAQCLGCVGDDTA